MTKAAHEEYDSTVGRAGVSGANVVVAEHGCGVTSRPKRVSHNRFLRIFVLGFSVNSDHMVTTQSHSNDGFSHKGR